MKIIPHHTKKGVKVVHIENGDCITPEEVIQVARRSGAVENAEKGIEALIWVQFGSEREPICYRVGYLMEWFPSSVVFTLEGLHYPEDCLV